MSPRQFRENQIKTKMPPPYGKEWSTRTCLENLNTIFKLRSFHPFFLYTINCQNWLLLGAAALLQACLLSLVYYSPLINLLLAWLALYVLEFFSELNTKNLISGNNTWHSRVSRVLFWVMALFFQIGQILYKLLNTALYLSCPQSHIINNEYIFVK